MVFQLPKAIRFALLGYAIAASLHTSNKLLATIFGSDTSLFGTSWWPYSKELNRQSLLEPQILLASPGSLDDAAPLSISESTFLSKAFSNSMQPNNIRPFYFRATHELDRSDVTITTQITLNRFDAFSNLVNKYQGPISVTIRISDSAVEKLQALYNSDPLMSRWVDVHLITDPFERQFNLWRNVARLFARTDYVLMLDVDFLPCTDFRKHLRQHVDMLKDGSAAFVIPAFEYIKQSDGLDANSFPTNKAELLTMVKQGRIDMFHRIWGAGHSSTDYERYYATEEMYKVTAVTHTYEPYVIMKKDAVPWCDERFVGYGANKAACLYEMYLSGVSFYILPDDFLVHQSHTYAEETRKNERKYNKKLYAEFREEVCLRYLTHFMLLGTLDSEAAQNAKSECQNVKGTLHAAAEMVSTIRNTKSSGRTPSKVDRLQN